MPLKLTEPPLMFNGLARSAAVLASTSVPLLTMVVLLKLFDAARTSVP